MLIFKVMFEIKNEEAIEARNYEEREELKNDIKECLYNFQYDLPEGIDIYLASLMRTIASFHVVVEMKNLTTKIERYIAELTEKLEWQGEITDIHETTITEFGKMIRRCAYIEDTGYVWAKHGIEDISSQLSRHGSETLIPAKLSKERCIEMCGELLCEESVLPELERIFDPNAPQEFMAHPVQYIIMSDSAKVRKSIREILLAALWGAGRLESRRVYLSLGSNINRMQRFFEPLKFEYMEKLYATQQGGAIVLPFAGAKSENNDDMRTANSDMTRIQNMLPLIYEYRHEVLSVIEIGRKDDSLYKMLCRELAGVVVVKLDETVVFREKAEEYLMRRAKRDNISDATSLLKELPKSDDGVVLTDLENIYSRWFDKYLHKNIYPSYKNFNMLGLEKAAEKPKGSAYEELDALIGLKEAKATVKQFLDFHRAQNIFAAHGKNIGQKPSMHMAFMGNPGTAKTTVARIVARIMKDNGLLSVGNLIEVGRKDLVDRFVGGTAPKVKSLFSRAKGSVLFIDEAYSLVDDRRGSFGDEAINTIVAEMENNREDVVVIFAGYPNEMEKFLDTNPGLRSRISFKVNFEDYSNEELLKIAEKFAKDDDFKLSDEVKEKLLKVIENHKKNIHKRQAMGNGRMVRNIYEKIRMRQASRIVNINPDEISDSTLEEFTVEDIEVTPDDKNEETFMGFRS